MFNKTSQIFYIAQLGFFSARQRAWEFFENSWRTLAWHKICWYIYHWFHSLLLTTKMDISNQKDAWRLCGVLLLKHPTGLLLPGIIFEPVTFSLFGYGRASSWWRYQLTSIFGVVRSCIRRGCLTEMGHILADSGNRSNGAEKWKKLADKGSRNADQEGIPWNYHLG